MILYPGENSWNTVRLDKRNYTAQKAKEQQKELIKRIPEQYIYIDDRCFRNAGRMKEVILSPQCKIIGKQAFESCQFRKGIDFPDTLIEIKKRAFAENHSLRQAIFPSSVKRIGAQCYRECNNLRVAKFEKITYGQFEKDWIDTFNVPELDTATKREIESIYEVINLPARATKFSAGYDFVSPLTFTLNPGETIKIPTGIRCGMNTDWVLMIYPRSGLGFKYQICLANTIGVVDADYYFSNNEGHIFVKLVNRGDKSVHINLGDAFAQGIFMEYGITEDDRVETFRNGGFGSTDKNK